MNFLPDRSIPQTAILYGNKYSIIVKASTLLLEFPCKYIMQGWDLS